MPPPAELSLGILPRCAEEGQGLEPSRLFPSPIFGERVAPKAPGGVVSYGFRLIASEQSRREPPFPSPAQAALARAWVKELRERVARMSEAKSEPGEGAFSSSRKNPSPALALLGDPLPQEPAPGRAQARPGWEREGEAELISRKPYQALPASIAKPGEGRGPFCDA